MHFQTSQSSGSCSCLNDVIHDINVERDREHGNPKGVVKIGLEKAGTAIEC